jgi:hypothetical protein
MRLGWTGALIGALVALGPTLVSGSAVADEPPGFAFSRKEPRVTPASFTSRGVRGESATPLTTGSTRALGPRDNIPAAEAPWTIRGTLGLPDLMP